VDIPKEKPADPFEPAELVIDSEARALPFPIVLSSKDAGHGDTVKRNAQLLHTKVYLEKGYITPEEIDEDGIFNDEYSNRSTYLFAENSLRDSTCRYISATKKDGIMSLPTAKYFSVDADAIRDASGVKRLSNLKSREVIEVSALASVQHGDIGQGRRGELDATRLLYARVLRDSLDQGHKLWLLNTHEALVRHLELLLGKEQIHRLGEVMEYMGSPTVPVAINPQDVVRTALADESDFGDMKRQYLQETLSGVSDRYLSKDLITLLELHKIPYERSPLGARILRHQKAIGYTAIAGYTIARAVPVANIEEFDGNPWIFFGIDFATSFPYAWGLVETVTGKTPLRRIAGGVTAAGSFAAPYVYFWAEGNDYPVWVNGVVGGIIGVAGLAAVNGIRKDNQLEKCLSKKFDPSDSHTE
jgi:hypothetical protein